MSLEGQQLGRYRFQRLLGSGGMGEVYLATDTIINRQVAIKVIRAEVAPYPDVNVIREAARLFQREMKAIATLDHPHILALYDYGESRMNDATFTYMVMPYRLEGTLTSWLQRRGRAEPLSPQEVASLIDQAASALQHAHNRQVIHQDVKPANFLIQSDEENPSRLNLLLADFGVAKFTSATASASQAVRGTPASMAPEQWEGHPVPATDQYALAVMAYELLAGRPPFQGGLSQVMFQHFNTPPPAPSTFNPRIPRAIDVVLLRALAKRADERFPSISVFARAFQEAVQQTASSPLASTPAPWTGPDIRATLAISTAEALSGTNRTLTLPGGRRITVFVPAGAYNGQVIRLEDQGESTGTTTPTGALILTLSIQQPEQTNQPLNTSVADRTARASDPNLPPLLVPPPGFQPPTPAVLASEINYPASIYATMPVTQEPGIRASDPGLGQAIAPPPPPPIQPLPTPARPTSPIYPGSRPPRSTMRAILLAGLALLIIAGGMGLFAFIHANQVATFNANGTATARAISNATTAATQNATNATAQAQVQGTASVIAANPDPYGGGTLALNDPLHDNNRGYHWPEGPLPASTGGACTFTGGAYHVSNPTNTGQNSDCGPTLDFSNFAFEVQMTILKGDAGGILIRTDAGGDKGYEFLVAPDGTCIVVRVDNSTTNQTLVDWNQTSAIKQSLGQTNLIAVVANGSTLTFYVNHQQVARVTDSRYNHGEIALVANSYGTGGHLTEVAFSNAKVWTF